MDFPLPCRLASLCLLLVGCGKTAPVGQDVPTPAPVAAAPSAGGDVALASHEAPVDEAASSARQAAAPKPLPPPTLSLETTWITDDYFAALIFHPRQILQKHPPREQLGAWLDAAAGDLGLSLEDVEQIAFLLGPPDPALREEFAAPVGTGWIFRFSTPAGQKKMLARFVGEEHQQHALPRGRMYYKHADAPMAICTPDERTVLLATERTVKTALASATPHSPLLMRLNEVPGRPDVVGAVHAAPLRPLLRQATLADPEKKPPPAWVRPLNEIVRHVSEATLTADLAGDPVARLTMEAESSESAVRLEELAQGHRGTAALLLPALKAQWLRGEESQGYAPLFQMASEMAAGVRVRRDLREVVVEAPAPAALPDLANILESAITSLTRGASRQERVGRLQTVGLAMHNYHVERGSFPDGATRDAAGRPLLSWRVHLLPFLGEEELYRQFRLDQPWNSPHNRALAPQIPAVYQTPGVAADGRTRVVALLGEGTPFALRSGPRLRDFTDGVENTVLLVECGPDRAVVWTQPDDLLLDPQNPIASLGAVDETGFLALFGDGRVEIIRPTITPAVLKALLTHASGD